MSVALVSEHASPLATLGTPDAGGQNVHVAALARELADLGCRVEVFTRRDSTRLREVVPLDTGVSVVHVDAGPPEPVDKDDLFEHMPAFSAVLRRRWEERGTRPDVAHAHFWMSGIATLHAKRDLALPMVQTFHALGVVKRRHQGLADHSPPERITTERLLLRSADQVVATCSDEIREIVALGGDRSKLSIVPCGVDPAFTPTGPAESTRRGRLRIVSVGRLVPRKGVDDVVTALASLPEVELVIAGGPSPDALDADPEVARLRALALERGVAERVVFRGSCSREEVAALLRSADVAVCAPWYEPFGIVPLEAMACGIPVVGSAVGGLLDTVVDGRTGLLVPPRRPDQLALAIGRLLGDGGLRRRMGRAGALRVDVQYRWPAIAAATLDVYDQVLRRATTDGVETSAAPA